MNDPSVAWQYKVIHLNVEADHPVAGPSADAAQAPDPPFTKTYLEQEFPGYYAPGNTTGQPLPESSAPPHPARQLQDFLNGHGREGWQLNGIYPLGKLLMIIFCRPAPISASPSPVDGANRDTELLQRLEALEARLATRDRASDQPSAHGSCLSADVLARLASQRQPVSTSEAARALGFRSTASLANPGNRAGYPLGLIKHGLDQKSAVYVGSGVGRRGGRSMRLWLLVSQAELATLL